MQELQGLDPAALAPEPKRSPVGSFLVGALVGSLIGAALTVAAMNAGRDATPAAEPLAVAASAKPSEEPAETEGEAEEGNVAPPEPVASVAPTSVPAAFSGGLIERAARGDEDALNQLEAKERHERHSEETLALAAGKGMRKLKDIEQLEKKLNIVPRFGREPETLKRIRELAYDSHVGVPMLKMLANLKNEVGADLLFSIWNRTSTPDFTSSLAGELLYSKDVYARASQAMQVILDLRSVKECDKVLAVMDRAKAHSDQRALLSLQPFYSHKGCGAFKESDCWPCLRATDLLEEATVAARTRAPP